MKKQEDNARKVEYYSSLPYTTAVTGEKQKDGGIRYVAKIVELPGCSVTGDTPEQAVRDLEANKRKLIQGYLLQEAHMPLPLRMRNYSGKFQVRISPSLHEAIALRAELDGISLNSYVAAALSRVVGQEESLEILIKDSPAAAGGPALRIRTKK